MLKLDKFQILSTDLKNENREKKFNFNIEISFLDYLKIISIKLILGIHICTYIQYTYTL